MSRCHGPTVFILGFVCGCGFVAVFGTGKFLELLGILLALWVVMWGICFVIYLAVQMCLWVDRVYVALDRKQ